MFYMKSPQTVRNIDLFYSIIRTDKTKVNIDRAAMFAINAAIGENPTYTPNTNHDVIRKKWKNLLVGLLPKYITSVQKPETFIQDVLFIKESMNRDFSSFFLNNGKGKDKAYDKEFRIAHAQKSLSVFLKHTWCIKNDMREPPICPIDSYIFKAADIKGTWTKLNDEKTYIDYIAKLQEAAKKENLSLARWELFHWNDEIIKRNNRKNINRANKKDSKEIKKHIDTLQELKKNGSDDVDKSQLLKVKNSEYWLFVARRKSNGNYYCELRCKDKNSDNELMSVIGNIMANYYDGKMKGKEHYIYAEFGNNADDKKIALSLMEKIHLGIIALMKG